MNQHIAVVGAGICGMCTALALSAKGNKVTVFERDVPPPEGGANEAFFDWKRRGAAQFRHPHAFLGLMCSILEKNYPDLVEEFWQAGARKVEFKDMIAPEMMENYSPAAGDEDLWILMCRRATMETVLRRYVERQANIVINNASIVTGILADESADVPNILGLTLSCDGITSEFQSDVVVDASGRTSKFRDWLTELNSEIRQEKEPAEIVYYTRHYKFLPGVEEPSRHGGPRSAGDLGYMKFGVFPGESGHFAIIICLPLGEEALREAVKTGATFDEICRSIPGLERWMSEDKAESTTVSFGFADINAVWKHFVNEGKPAALNFFAVGDACIRTNPLYGRGCSIGAQHAHLLADLLVDIADPTERAIAFEQRTEDALRPIYNASLSEDKRGIKRAQAIIDGIELDQTKGLKKWFAAAFGDAIGAASREQIHVLRGAMRTFNLLEKPGEFLKDWKIRMTLFRYLLRGRKNNAPLSLQPGPKREEMLALVEQDEAKAA